MTKGIYLGKGIRKFPIETPNETKDFADYLRSKGYFVNEKGKVMIREQIIAEILYSSKPGFFTFEDNGNLARYYSTFFKVSK